MSEPAPVRLLRSMASGGLQVRWNGREVASIDASTRDIHLEVSPLAADGWNPLGRGSGIGPGQALNLARSLSRERWRVEVRKDDHELVRMGRGVSPLTGHVMVTWRGMRELLRSR